MKMSKTQTSIMEILEKKGRHTIQSGGRAQTGGKIEQYGRREMIATQKLIDAGLVRIIHSETGRDSARGYTHYYRTYTIALPE